MACLALAALAVAACSVKRDVVRPVDFLAAGQAQFAAGDYEPAALYLERYLEAPPTEEGEAEALFRLFLIHMLPESPLRDLEEAERYLERLAGPGEALHAAASMVWSLHLEVQSLEESLRDQSLLARRLAAQLEELKRIDLEGPPG